MKKLLTITFLFPALLLAQQKSPGFIKKYHYLKLSPTAMGFTSADNLINERNAFHPALFATVGGKVHRYAAIGIGSGYFALTPQDQSAIPVIPVGIDLTLTDFQTKKAFPVITAQWYYAFFKEQYTERLSRYSSASYDIKGKYMFNVGAGVAFRALKTKKILITGSFAKLTAKATIHSSSLTPVPGGSTFTSSSTVNEHQDILMLSGSLVF